jgi:fatty-acyl-CoA synthase
VRYHVLEDLTVMDPETMTPVPSDGETIGEVMFRGNVVMKGYLKNPAATDEAFAGGWFHSGDLGVLHPDGYIQLKDRSKDIIISGGENISSIEVEDVLYRHPAVSPCGRRRPDDKWGETPCAFIELKAGGEPPTARRDDRLLPQNLARYKCPRHVVFGELPKTSTGKIQKFKLRDSLPETRAQPRGYARRRCLLPYMSRSALSIRLSTPSPAASSATPAVAETTTAPCAQATGAEAIAATS